MAGQVLAAARCGEAVLDQREVLQQPTEGQFGRWQALSELISRESIDLPCELDPRPVQGKDQHFAVGAGQAMRQGEQVGVPHPPNLVCCG